VFSTLFGLALLKLGDAGRPLATVIATLSYALYGVVALVMRLAPIGSFGAMAFTIGRYGLGSLVSLGALMIATYTACLLFVFVVLGTVLIVNGLGVWRFIRYLRDELLIVLGTSSSESVLPQLMRKMEHLGCAKSVVGLVVPAGYSFNLDGTAIYMAMAAVFVAQVSGVELSLGQEVSLFAVLLLTSKGAAAVTGSGFVTLAATLAVFPAIPSAGLVLLIGVDRFMSEIRAITNLVGNAVATIVVARWDNAIDLDRARAVLAGRALPSREEVIVVVEESVVTSVSTVAVESTTATE
jgi:aerobic C4-dicarboxylate transport protein